MRTRLTGALAALVLAGAVSGLWWDAGQAPAPPAASLPVPPFPPRIAAGETYEHCLAVLADDPDSAKPIADAWAAAGGGDGAAHCQGLALIATGRPDLGAERLEQLAKTSLAPNPARATIFGQAAQARLMGNQADQAYADMTEALALAPYDTELLVSRAAASAAREAWAAAIDDLNDALARDPHRADALVLRAAAWRGRNRLDLALADADRAISLDPDNPEALLERGIVRQRLGDAAGARLDWERARGLAPNSTTADLAEQNLALLDAGPNQR